MKTILILLCIFLWNGVLFASYKNDPVLNEFLAVQPPISQHKVSQVILSYKGEPLCVVNTGRHPSLVPSFLPVASSSKSEQLGTLPECDVDDMNRIYQVAQNAVLVDRQKGIKVAALALPAVVGICVGSVILPSILAYGGNIIQQSVFEERLGVVGTSISAFIGHTVNVSLYASEKSWQLGLDIENQKDWKKIFSRGVHPLMMACSAGGAFGVYYLLKE